MNYTFVPHLRAIAAGKGESKPATHLFALADAARFDSTAKKAVCLLSHTPTERVFEDSFARSALHLSPLLIELSDSVDTRLEQMVFLDNACCGFPMLTFIRSRSTLRGLVMHLRSVLLIEAERVPYLLRYADTQMMTAANAAFSPAQRSTFFDGMDAWFTVNYQSLLDDAADDSAHPQAGPVERQPILLDAEQTTALLQAVAVPVLASQMRNLASSFAAALTHAQQTAFAAECVVAAGGQVDDDSVLTSNAMQRWQRQLSLQGTLA